MIQAHQYSGSDEQKPGFFETPQRNVKGRRDLQALDLVRDKL